MVEIYKEFKFSAAHQLPNVHPKHPCGHLHGHNYTVRITLRGVPNPEKGWLIDFSEITAAWHPLHYTLDHQCLNDVPGLENPTSENLAMWIYGKLRGLPYLYQVEVQETDSSGVVFPVD